MISAALTQTVNRLRPSEGWLSLLLLACAAGTMIQAVLAAAWVPEADVVTTTTTLGLLLGVLLAKRPLSPRPAWLLITLYGVLTPIVHLAQLWPPPTVLFGGALPLPVYWRQNGALFLDRTASWFRAVFTGGSSEETIVFALGLGLLAWFLATFAGWSTFRMHQPLRGLALMGIAVAVNGYFSATPIFWPALFVALMALLTAVVYYATLEKHWTDNQIDYAEDVRWELALYAGVIAMVLLTFAVVLPGLDIGDLSRRFMAQPAVQEAEETLERAFAGVRQPQQGDEPSSTGPGGSGAFPRSYLLGNAPELAEIVVMTTTVSIVESNGSLSPAPAAWVQSAHWRALSYDVYTGRGWAISEERREPTPANQPIPLPPAADTQRLAQTVHWTLDERVIRYTLGQPLVFDQEVTVFWRGLADLVRVQGEGVVYTGETQLSTADATALRKTAVTDVPPAILGRYTALPPTVPARVHDLAQAVAGALRNPYDQARALEEFLRQYPYSLDVSLPPSDQDPVDYFLFTLQTGYCDYYASAMVVLARSLGLPARMGVGFLSPPPDENGQQTIYQLNAHSWAEIYFAGYGWIEFEPTAPFPNPRDPAAAVPAPTDDVPADATAAPPPLPEPDPAPLFPWRWVGLPLLLLVLMGLIWYGARQSRQRPHETVWAYGRLHHHARKLGHSLPASQTPLEFAAAFLAFLQAQTPNSPRARQQAARVQRPLQQLTQRFAEHQYRGEEEAEAGLALHAWREMKRPLWWLRLLTWRSGKNNPDKQSHEPSAD